MDYTDQFTQEKEEQPKQRIEAFARVAMSDGKMVVYMDDKLPTLYPMGEYSVGAIKYNHGADDVRVVKVTIELVD